MVPEFVKDKGGVCCWRSTQFVTAIPLFPAPKRKSYAEAEQSTAYVCLRNCQLSTLLILRLKQDNAGQEIFVMELTVDEALQKALEAHKAGQVREADRLYTAILRAQPKHPDANHNIGVLAVEVGKVREALPFFKTALEANPSVAQFWLSYIDAHIKLELFEDASKLLYKAKALGASGESFEEIDNLLISCLEKPTQENSRDNRSSNIDFDESDILLDELSALVPEDSYQVYAQTLAGFQKDAKLYSGLENLFKSVTARSRKNVIDPPEDAVVPLFKSIKLGHNKKAIYMALNLLGVYSNSLLLINLIGSIHQTLGNYQEAIRCFMKALKIRPDNAEIYFNLGVTYKSTGDLNSAVKAYKKAISIRKIFAEAHYSLGNAYRAKLELQEATKAFKMAVSIQPKHVSAWFNLGNTFADQKLFTEAIEAFRKALMIQPDFVKAKSNLGITLKDLGEYEEAIAILDEVIQHEPFNAIAYSNRGVIFERKGELNNAITAYETAINIEPDLAEAHKNLSHALLNFGDLERGLKEYEWRWNTAEFRDSYRYKDSRKWDRTKDLTGKKILIWGEQGIGDTINWCSRLSLIAHEAKHCVLECHEKLVPLLRKSFPEIEIRTQSEHVHDYLDGFDFHLPLGSLYLNYIDAIKQCPLTDPYLHVNQDKVDFWKQRLRSIGEGPFIGLSWKSSKLDPDRLPNYAKLTDLSPILKIQGLTFINLQYSDFDDEIQTVYQDLGVKIHNLTDLDHFNDLENAASFYKALDAVVATKNTVALLSAGVGTQTKLANWRNSSWNNSLFNPSGRQVEIYERDTSEEWETVFSMIANDLKKLTQG